MAGSGYAQKNSAAAGNWGTASSWSPSGVPASGDVVNVNHVMNLNTGLSSTSTITFNTGSSGSSGTALLNMSGGTLDVKGNVTFTSSNHNLNSGTRQSQLILQGPILSLLQRPPAVRKLPRLRQ